MFKLAGRKRCLDGTDWNENVTVFGNASRSLESRNACSRERSES